MKALFLSLFAMLLAIAACAQQPTPSATHVLRYQQCPWKDVVVVQTGDQAAARTTSIGLFTLPKTSTRKTFADLTPKELKQVKKAAKRAHSCLVTVDDDYHIPKQVKNPDPKKEAELNAQLLFYFMVPSETIDHACDLPPYRKRDRDKLAAAKAGDR